MKTKLFVMLLCGVMCAGFCACEKNESETLPEFVNVPTDTIKGHYYVDLGLPSRTLWATCNIGATSPEVSGDYFAWGETKTKSVFKKGKEYYAFHDAASNVTKYCTNSNDGTVDNKTVLEAVDDAATINWMNTATINWAATSNVKDAWRMPTKADFDEIETHCSWTWASLNGVTGYQVEGSNGNSIFIPCVNDRAYYWSSSLYDSQHAYSMFFHIDKRFACSDYRYCGRLIRPVYLPLQ